MSTRLLIVVPLVLAVGAGAAVWLLQERGQTDEQLDTDTAASRPAESKPATAPLKGRPVDPPKKVESTQPSRPSVAERIRPIRNPESPMGMTRFPDGTYLKNLNGVKRAMSWDGSAFTPIIDIIKNDQGVEFWVHKDGSQTAPVVLKGIINGVPGETVALQRQAPIKGVENVPLAPHVKNPGEQKRSEPSKDGEKKSGQ